MDENPTLLRMEELETPENVAEKVDKLTVFGGLDGVLKEMVRIQVPSACTAPVVVPRDLKSRPCRDWTCLPICALIQSLAGTRIEHRGVR